jgi:hypothetical protein
LARRCLDNEGWRVGIGGVVVALGKRNTNSGCRLRWPTLLVSSQPMGIKSVGLIHVPTLLS